MYRLLYLSGAPRVTTGIHAPEPGARAHVLGTIAGFQAHGWSVDRLICGDHLPFGSGRTDGGRPKSWMRKLAQDGVRLAIGGAVSPVAASRRRPDLCYERLAAFMALGRWARQRHGAPWVLETQALQWRDASERHAIALPRLARSIEYRAYRSADLVVAVSAAVAHDVIELAGVDPGRVLVVPNGVDTARFTPPDPPRSVPRDRLRMVFVGTLLAWQALDQVLEAIARVRAQGIPIEFDIVGDGAVGESLRARAAQEDLRSAVRFHGLVGMDVVPGLLAAADIGFSGHRPTSGRTMHHSPLKLYEYAASGLPFVASAYDDAIDIAPPAATGLLFRHGEPDELVRALQTAWNLREQLPAIGQELRRRAVERYSWRHRVATLLERVRMPFHR